jgi:hypothetical protein
VVPSRYNLPMLLVAPGPRPPQRPDPRGFDSGIVLRDELLSAWSLLGPVQHGLRTLGTPAALEALAALPAIAGEIDGAVARWAQGDDDALPALEAAAALVCLGLGYERMGGALAFAAGLLVAGGVRARRQPRRAGLRGRAGAGRRRRV